MLKKTNEKVVTDIDRTNSFILFCSTISIRGINKISRGPQTLRILWLSFIIIMSSILITASCLLVRDFMLYDVNINTQDRLDSQTEFPALTICHHHPFSRIAYQLWQNKSIPSPTEFNRIIRDLTRKQLEKEDVKLASMVSYSDVISMYYQNLTYKEALKVGHDFDIFLSCMYLRGNVIVFADNCSTMEDYKIKLYSHHEHFNCYTFEATSTEVSSEIKMLGIIVSLGPPSDYSHHEQAFIVDSFRQAKGLKVLVHEPYTMPDIDNEGLHVEPGKMNEISYRPIEWELTNTPTKPCIDSSKEYQYKDLENTFNYTKSMCLKYAQQLEIISKCKCTYIYNPRPHLPSKEIPYCGNILRNFSMNSISDRLDCLVPIADDKDFIKKLEKEKCFERCHYLKYENSISVTKWRATEWHLHWLRVQLNSLNELIKLKKKYPNRTIKSSKFYDLWMSYGKETNLSTIAPTNKEQILEGTNFAYIVLRRESENSVKKYERLVITPYVLISRVGGLCSLTVGITLAFLVELIEFFYLYTRRKRRRKTTKMKTNLVIKNVSTSMNPDDVLVSGLLQSCSIEENTHTTQRDSNCDPWQRITGPERQYKPSSISSNRHKLQFNNRCKNNCSKNNIEQFEIDQTSMDNSSLASNKYEANKLDFSNDMRQHEILL